MKSARRTEPRAGVVRVCPYCGRWTDLSVNPDGVCTDCVRDHRNDRKNMKGNGNGR